MKNLLSRLTFIVPVFLTALYVVIDLAVDDTAEGPYFTWAHVVSAGLVVMLSAILLARWLRVRRESEALLQRAHDELEARVRERTAELEAANAALQAEIAERERVEQALRLSEETARALMDVSLESAVLIDTEGVVLVANETSARGLGVTVDRMIGRSVFDLFPPDVAASRRRHFDEVLRTGLPLSFEDERDGRSFHIQVQPVHDADGKVIRAAAFGLDITDRKQAEMALRASEEKYRLLFHNMAEGFALYELIYDEAGQPVDWRILEVNEAYTRHTGLSAERVVGRRVSELFPQAVPEFLPRFVQVVASGIPSSHETHAPWVGRYQRVSTFPAGGNRFANTVEDITARRQAELELRTSEEKFARIFDFSPDAIALVSLATHKVLDVNRGFTRILGHERADMVGKAWPGQGVVSEADVARMMRLVQGDGNVTDVEVDLTTRSGETATVLASVIPLTVNEEPCLLLIAHDITERKRSEEALRRAEAEVARGIEARVAIEERQRLSRELHDSVSQALYGVTLGINTAKTYLDTNKEHALKALDYSLSLSRAGLSEMRALIFDLRPESLETEGLIAALTKRAEVLRTRHELQVTLNLGCEPDLPLRAKEALYRIAQEAMQNAVKHAQASHMDISLTCAEEFVRLEVCDDGVGFDASGEFPGHLGLRSMRERAEGVGGSLEVISAPGRGTRVVAVMPKRNGG